MTSREKQTVVTSTIAHWKPRNRKEESILLSREYGHDRVPNATGKLKEGCLWEKRHSQIEENYMYLEENKTGM